MSIPKIKTIQKIFANSLTQLIAVILLISLYHTSLTDDTIRFFLTISSCLKEILIFVLPFLLFSFVAVALSAIPKEGMLFVFGLILLVFISNFCNILISGVVGFSLLNNSHTHQFATNAINLTPFFSFNIPPITETIYALTAGVLIGLFNAYKKNVYINKFLFFIRNAVLLFMKQFFIPLLPIFVGGFLLKLFREGRMTGFIEQNLHIVLIMCSFLIVYMFIWLIFAASFNLSKALEIAKNIFPATMTAFSTMSSAAALPFSLEAAEKNTKDKVLADAVMPLTLNFHMVGDTIIVPILAMIVMLAFDKPLPDVTSFLLFGVFFVLNKFAGGGVPSGTIMVTIPVLKQYFHFDDSMIAFIVAFYGVIDPIATSCNVTANNLFVIFFQKMRANCIKKH